MPLEESLRQISERSCVKPAVLQVGPKEVLLWYHRNERARRYILRVKNDGSARVTIPRGGCRATAWEFVQKHLVWIENQLAKVAQHPREAPAWRPGAAIWFRGEQVTLRCVEAQLDPSPPETGAVNDWPLALSNRGVVEFADQRLEVADIKADLRPAVENHLKNLARAELVDRTFELAANHGVLVKKVVVRNQRSRWGSCSVRGTVSLNWRLIQAPILVRDYLIIHELMHVRDMNHSRRYWQRVEAAFPLFRVAELWLRRHGLQLH